MPPRARYFFVDHGRGSAESVIPGLLDHGRTAQRTREVRVSITDDARSESRPPAQPSAGGGPPRGGGDGPATGGFDRSPPQDVAAEQGVLGGMLLSKDAIADVVEILKVQDF